MTKAVPAKLPTRVRGRDSTTRTQRRIVCGLRRPSQQHQVCVSALHGNCVGGLDASRIQSAAQLYTNSSSSTKHRQTGRRSKPNLGLAVCVCVCRSVDESTAAHPRSMGMFRSLACFACMHALSRGSLMQSVFFLPRLFWRPWSEPTKGTAAALQKIANKSYISSLDRSTR